MKKILALLFALFISIFLRAQTNTFPSSGSAGIGTLSPNASSVLDMTSSTQGVLVPRMSMANRNAIASPATGLLIYQTDSNSGFFFYNGTAWNPVSQNGANKNLSNLSSTAANTDLLPANDKTQNMGSLTKNWKSVYANSVLVDSDVFLSSGGGSYLKSTLLGATHNTTNAANDNTFVGQNAGALNTIGVSNTFVGSDCGSNNVDGGRNSFFGVNAGNANSSGRKNCFYGFSSGNFNTTGFTNAFYGYKSGMYNVSGNDNTFIGNESGHLNTTASGNTFVGAGSGHDNTTGASNTCLGSSSGASNTTGNNNVFIGVYNGNKNLTGNDNVFMGSNGGKNNTTGSNNVFIGDSSAFKNSTGFFNTFVGEQTGFNHTTGSNNTFLGRAAGYDITTGSTNTFIGASVSATSGTIANSIAIGYNFKINQSNIIQLGNSSIIKIGIGKSPDSNNIMDFAVTTAKLTTGGAWTNASDRRLKNNFQDLDANDILNKVSQLKIQRWHYIADHDASTHIGPVAQDFHQLFNVGDDTTISTIDPSGVALLAIQALTEEQKQNKATIAQQQAQIDELKTMIADMQQSLSQCCMNYQSSKQQIQSTNENEGAYLEQNVPNPFSANTIIKCYLPSTAKSASITIATLDGKELKSFSLSNPGINEITVNGGTLPAGEYLYSLVIDGNRIDSKRMMLTY